MAPPAKSNPGHEELGKALAPPAKINPGHEELGKALAPPIQNRNKKPSRRTHEVRQSHIQLELMNKNMPGEAQPTRS